MRGRRASVYRVSALCALLGLCTVTAQAEDLTFDYEANDKLAAFMNDPDQIVYSEEQKSHYLLRFVIDGESAESWIEALEMINTLKKGQPKTVAKWYEQFRETSDKNCPSDWQLLSEADFSIIFERKSPDCGGFEAQVALYRVLYGRRNIFILIATRLEVMDEETKASWLRVLESAEINK